MQSKELSKDEGALKLKWLEMLEQKQINIHLLW